MDKQMEQLRKMGKPELAVSIAGLVRETICPDGKWTIERGRDCIEVLLIAARMAYPTSADIESLGSGAVTEVALKMADEINVIKEEARTANEESP